jgi:hypothetical protein
VILGRPMTFARRHLYEGEDVVLETRPHWSFLGWAPAAVCAAVAGSVAAVVAWPDAPAAAGWGLLALVGSSALWLAARWLRWRTTVMVLTTSRLLQRSGVVARRGVEVRRDRIIEVFYEQSVLERLVGTGRLYLDVGGGRGVVAFDHVKRPAALAAALGERTDGAASGWPRAGTGTGGAAEDTPPAGTSRLAGGLGRAAVGPAVGPAGGPGQVGPERSVARQLMELDELRRRGILSEEEFEEHKGRLLRHL